MTTTNQLTNITTTNQHNCSLLTTNMGHNS